jgi:hypothetical protein
MRTSTERIDDAFIYEDDIRGGGSVSLIHTLQRAR